MRMVITDDKESRQGSGRQFSPLNRPDHTYTCTNAQTQAHTKHASGTFFHLHGVRGVI